MKTQDRFLSQQRFARGPWYEALVKRFLRTGFLFDLRLPRRFIKRSSLIAPSRMGNSTETFHFSTEGVLGVTAITAATSSERPSTIPANLPAV